MTFRIKLGKTLLENCSMFLLLNTNPRKCEVDAQHSSHKEASQEKNMRWSFDVFLRRHKPRRI
jgi:hypothetical protein